MMTNDDQLNSKVSEKMLMEYSKRTNLTKQVFMHRSLPKLFYYVEVTLQ